MTRPTKLALVALLLFGFAGLIDAALARGGGGSNTMNSPGYQRRLQESRQQLGAPGMQPARIDRRKPQRHRRH